MNVKELAVIVDQYAKKREERLLADKVASNLKAEEEKFKGQIIAALIEGNSTTAGGKSAKVNMHKKDKPVAKEWPLLYSYIRANDAFDLLHKRLTEEAFNARKEEGIIIPGVDWFPVYSLTVAQP